jgi:hypothetical protein
MLLRQAQWSLFTSQGFSDRYKDRLWLMRAIFLNIRLTPAGLLVGHFVRSLLTTERILVYAGNLKN